MGDELADMPAEFGGNAGMFIYLGRHPTAGQVNADFVLPITTFAEQEGTFVNVDGRVQRFWPALQVPGSARPAWLVLGAVLAELTDDEVPQTAAASFARAASSAGVFAGLSYENIGTRGAVVNEPVELGA
jgi:NADH-quinone oxidoreductase subunit G